MPQIATLTKPTLCQELALFSCGESRKTLDQIPPCTVASLQQQLSRFDIRLPYRPQDAEVLAYIGSLRMLWPQYFFLNRQRPSQ